MMHSAVIDFQAYRSVSNSIIVKELSIVDINHGSSWHWFFKPPYDDQEIRQSKKNLWVKKNLHGIDWYYGDEDYNNIKSCLLSVTKNYNILWAKGMEKCKFIEELIDQPVYDLHDFECPNLKKLENDNIMCHFHLGSLFVCSLNQAHRLATWIRRNPCAVDFKKEEVRRQSFWKISDHLPSFAGFIRYTNGNIKCVYCGLIAHSSTTNLLKHHKANSPNCQWFEKEYL